MRGRVVQSPAMRRAARAPQARRALGDRCRRLDRSPPGQLPVGPQQALQCGLLGCVDPHRASPLQAATSARRPHRRQPGCFRRAAGSRCRTSSSARSGRPRARYRRSRRRCRRRCRRRPKRRRAARVRARTLACDPVATTRSALAHQLECRLLLTGDGSKLDQVARRADPIELCMEKLDQLRRRCPALRRRRADHRVAALSAVMILLAGVAPDLSTA